MALTGLSVIGTTEFQSKRDPSYGTDKATVFELGTLDIFITSWLTDRAMVFGQRDDGNNDVMFRTKEANLDAVRFGLKGIRNFVDRMGSEIKFRTIKRNVNGITYQVVADDVLRYFDLETIEELATELRRLNTVTQAEAKNSEPALSP
jgi:hypothetical protein